MYLLFGRHVIIEALKSDSLAKIVIPPNNEIMSYKEAIGVIYLLLFDVWSTMDGIKLYLQQSSKTEIQACFYNGWMHGHCDIRLCFLLQWDHSHCLFQCSRIRT